MLVPSKYNAKHYKMLHSQLLYQMLFVMVLVFLLKLPWLMWLLLLGFSDAASAYSAVVAFYSICMSCNSVVHKVDMQTHIRITQTLAQEVNMKFIHHADMMYN